MATLQYATKAGAMGNGSHHGRTTARFVGSADWNSTITVHGCEGLVYYA